MTGLVLTPAETERLLREVEDLEAALEREQRIRFRLEVLLAGMTALALIGWWAWAWR